MTFQLPEPTHTNPAGKPFYTEAQFKQGVRDVLEQAAQNLDTNASKCASVLDSFLLQANAIEIRKMIGEIK